MTGKKIISMPYQGIHNWRVCRESRWPLYLSGFTDVRYAKAVACGRFADLPNQHQFMTKVPHKCQYALATWVINSL